MRILVWLSGWVDSAVTAYLLQQAWHDVVAWFMVNYTDTDNPFCTTRQDKESAQSVEDFLWLPLEIFDFRTEYKERIIDYIIAWYKQWITPNPDVFCNNLIKFDLFMEEALAMGCDAIATWHYANIVHSQNSDNTKIYSLLRAKDDTKDQSYFLSRLSQYQLAHALLPLGNITKDEVRLLAHQIWLPNADRKDSQGLCFIGNVSIKDFLQQYLPKSTWNIIDTSWKIVWQHQGAYAFTLWQKRWLNINIPAYVIDIHVSHNTVTVATEKDHPRLYSTHHICTHRHSIDPDYDFDQSKSYTVKLRYRQEPQACIVAKEWKNIIIQTEQKQYGIPSGQIAVVYDGDVVIGCGVITERK